MNAVRFLYTSQPGKGFVELTNPDYQLKNWLKDSLRQPHSPSYTRTLDKGLSVSVQDFSVQDGSGKECWVICTCLTRQTDDNGRPFIRNHSVLVPVDEYNSLAADFDRTIMAQIIEGDEEVLTDGELKPLNLPKDVGDGLQGEDMEALADDFGPDLEKLLASLVAGKPFSISKRGTTDDAIYLARTLLKTAELLRTPDQEALVVPQFATFEPNSKTRSWYPSQVLPNPRLRVNLQFHQRNSPDDKAKNTARHLVEPFVKGDREGVRSALRAAKNYDELKTYSPPSAVIPPAARAPQKAEASPPDSNDAHIYQFNKEYQVALNNRKEELDKRELKLDARQEDLAHQKRTQQQEIDRQERELSEREGVLEKKKGDVDKMGARRSHWRHIEKIFDALEKNNDQKLEQAVLVEVFYQLKNLDQDKLQDIQSEIEDFIPELRKIAESDEAGKSTFLKDLESIENKLEGKSGFWSGLRRS